MPHSAWSSLSVASWSSSPASACSADSYWTEAWYGFIGFDNPDRRAVGTEDLLLSYSRLFGLPSTQRWTDVPLPPRELGAVLDQLPVAKVLVADRPGIYIDFVGDGDQQQLDRRTLDIVRWTAPDGTSWTVEGILPRADLIALGEEVYRPVVFQAFVPVD